MIRLIDNENDLQILIDDINILCYELFSTEMFFIIQFNKFPRHLKRYTDQFSEKSFILETKIPFIVARSEILRGRQPI